jgi:hypothetical protein
MSKYGAGNVGALKALSSNRPNSHSLAINQKKQSIAEGNDSHLIDTSNNEEGKEVLQNVKISASPPSIIV